MAEISGQTDPGEAIEAKLCAYLEDELAPPDRAEIEEYLKNYPQHRQTLSDLAATRTVLRGLPKEKTPPEVAESFQGQMERSMLLDGPNNDDVIVRLKHGPQLALAAAIVALAVGLGIVVYIILPGPVQKYSVAPQAPVAPAPSLGPAVVAIKPPGEVNAPPVVAPAAPAKTLDELNSAMTAKSPAASAGNVATLEDKADGIQSAPHGRSEAAADTGASTPLSSAGNSSGTVRLVVHTDDPALANKQIQTYFAANNVDFKLLDDESGAMGGGANSQASASKDAAVRKMLPASQPIVLANNGASTQPIVQAQIQDRDRQMNQNRQLEPTDSGKLVYVAHSMTRQEASQLNAALSTQQIGQRSDLYFPGASSSGVINLASGATTQPTTAPVATTLPTTGPTAIAIGDSLTVTVAQLVGPGVDKTNTVRVADNGTISLPMIEPVPAAGESPADLEKQIAAKYKEADLIPQATVTVAPAATTQPTETAEIPATQPTEAERVDVMVVVERNAATTQPATPTTEPAGP